MGRPLKEAFFPPPASTVSGPEELGKQNDRHLPQDATVEHLVQAIKQHHLMPSREWAAMRERWLRPGRKEIADVPTFCRWLVSNTFLSELQVRYLRQGQAQLLQLGEYRVRDRVVSGPMKGGLIADDALGRRVVIEILAPRMLESPTSLIAIREMVEKVMRLKHPHIGRLLGLGSAHGLTYLVKEPYEGETLASVLKRRGKLRYEPATRLAAFALAALQALHEHGIPGGELGPECLLLTAAHGTQRREVKLLDVGVQRRLFDNSSLTPPGEQATPIRLDTTSFLLELKEQMRPEDDLFRLGCTFYLALTGKPPFSPEELPAPAHKADSPRALVPEIPELLAELVERMIDPVASNRPASAGHAARTLRIILATEEETNDSRPEENLALPTATGSKHASEPPRVQVRPRKKKKVAGTIRAKSDPPVRRASTRPAGSLRMKTDLAPTATLFAGIGAAVFIIGVLLLNLITGWELINLVCLLTGATFSYLADQVLRWGARSGM